MTFQEKLAEYIEQLDCTAKMLSERSGLSAATISRYRSGDRVPEADSDNLANLVTGIVRIAGEKGLSEFTIQTVTDSFLPYVKSKNPDIDMICTQNSGHIFMN